MNRRDALKILALAAAMPCAAAESTPKQPLGLVIHSYWIRRERPLAPAYGSIAEPLAFLEVAAKLGARGIQTKLSGLDQPAIAALREATERLGMYVEGTVNLPKDEGDLARFEADVVSSKAAGATVLRSVCMNGRRYEVFDSLEKFQHFATQSWSSLVLAGGIAAKHQIRLAIENHKDWRIDEMLGWLKRLSSPNVGVCLDTGNSMALLEDPHAVVDAFAPWTFSTHVKDMAVEEYPAGFHLSEVPFGDGCLDLKRVFATLRKARPEVRFNLEMITRDPLKVPCLTPKYWETLGTVSGRELADTLSRIRQHKSAQPLPKVSPLTHAEQLRVEADNINRCLKYAAEHLA